MNTTCTTRLIFKNHETNTTLMTQDFPREFTSMRTAEKYLESKVSGMKAISLEIDVRIFGQVIDPKNNVITSIALF